MDTNDTLPANKVRVLRSRGKPNAADIDADTESALPDEMSRGFDPYDTASLYVQPDTGKTADQS